MTSSEPPATLDNAPFHRRILQDWSANRTRIDARVVLAFYRLAHEAGSWPAPIRLPVIVAYWIFTSVILGIEIPPKVVIGPRLRLYHPHGIGLFTDEGVGVVV